MASYLSRYVAGEYDAVWAELRSLGRIPDAVAEDCAAVARQTMERVRRHVVRLTEQYAQLGFTVWEPFEAICPPSQEDSATLDLLAAEIGGLPAALDACLRCVGSACLVGEVPALDPAPGSALLLPDPLVLPSVQWLAEAWSEVSEGGPDSEVDDDPRSPFSWDYYEQDCFYFSFAPDEDHKAGLSGGTYDIRLPSTVADPVIRGIDDGVLANPTLVEYLRHAVAWGGRPGWAKRPHEAPAALENLQVYPDF